MIKVFLSLCDLCVLCGKNYQTTNPQIMGAELFFLPQSTQRSQREKKKTFAVASLAPLFLLILLFSCSSNSLEDFREEGKNVTRELIAELKTLHVHQDFASHAPKLKKLFLEQVEIIERLNRWRKENNAEAPFLELSTADQQLSQKLEHELTRIYKIEGGRKFLQKCQEEALHRLANAKTQNVR